MGIAPKKVAKRWMKEPGFREGYEALDIPYMPHIPPEKRW